MTGGPLANMIDVSALAASTAPNLTTVTIDGGAGDDTITGTNLADTIDGGAGNDTILGLGGDDTIRGGLGNDTILGGAGADTIFGDTAADSSPTLVGLDGMNLVRFSAAAPTTPIGTPTPIMGVGMGETILGLDTRPATGVIYALTTDGMNTGRLYTIDPSSGVATLASTLAADPSDMTTPYTALSGTDFGVDFNPVADRLRVVSNTGQDLRINVQTGLVTTDGGLAYAAGDANTGAIPDIVAAAYTNAFGGAKSTTLYDIDMTLGILVTQNPPNSGTLNTVGPLGVIPTAISGFDILPGTNTALATLTVGGTTELYSIDLMTGTATAVGDVLDGMTPINGLTALADNDAIVWNQGDGSDTIDGGSGYDTLTVNGSNSGDAFAVDAGTAGRLNVSRANLTPFTLDTGTLESVTVNGLLGDDGLAVGDLSAVPNFAGLNFNGGEGSDNLVFAQGATLRGGVFDGGAGFDGIDYSAYTTAVTVDLSGGQQVFTADLSGSNEVMSNSSPATGTGTFILNQAGTALDFTVNYQDLQGSFNGVLDGFPAHFHNAPAGMNGPIVYALTTSQLNGKTTPNGTFSGSWTSTSPMQTVPVPSGPLTTDLVQQLKQGNIYFNIHTTEFPGGEIRGQLVLAGTSGTATGTAGLLNVEDVIGGSGDDTLTGNDQSNTLTGGKGADTIDGMGGDDLIIWNNGDGSDTVDGGSGTDVQRVNGSTQADTFVIAAGMGGRLAFSRTSPGPFMLNIGTVEGLDVRAGLGQDVITVQDLTGVADLKFLNLQGEFENDTIDASALPAGLVDLTIDGGAGNDMLVGSAGADVILGGQGNDTIIGNKGNDTIDAGITADHALFAALTADNSVLIFNADTSGQVLTVPLTGLQAGEKAVGVAFRPNETADVLYVLTNLGNVYTTTPNGMVMPLSLLTTTPTGTRFGVNFNPVPDRLRAVSNTGQDLRANVDTGATTVDGTLAFATGDMNAGATPNVVGVAYTNAFAGATSTSLFDIDSTLDVLPRRTRRTRGP